MGYAHLPGHRVCLEPASYTHLAAVKMSFKQSRAVAQARCLPATTMYKIETKKIFKQKKNRSEKNNTFQHLVLIRIKIGDTFPLIVVIKCAYNLWLYKAIKKEGRKNIDVLHNLQTEKSLTGPWLLLKVDVYSTIWKSPSVCFTGINSVIVLNFTNTWDHLVTIDSSVKQMT